MEDQLTTQQTKPDPKGKAIASLVLGIISAIPSIMFILTPKLLNVAFTLFEPLVSPAFFGTLFLSPIVGIAALILGIFGLKSIKRHFAIIGIMLGLFGLGISLFYWMLFFLLP